MTGVKPTRHGEDWLSGANSESEHGRGQRLQTRGAVLRQLTADLIGRSRRALERSRALLGDAYRIVNRTDLQR